MKSNIPKPKHSQLGLYIILLLIVPGIMVAIKTCSFQGKNSDILQNDTITVGIQYSPLSFYMYDDTLGGFDYELLKLIAQQQNKTFKYIPITTEQEGLSGLDENRYSVVAADYPLTTEMRDDYLFTQPAYLDRQVLVQLTDSTDATPCITSVLDLRGDTVYIPEGSPIGSRIQHLSEEVGDTIYVKNLPYTPEQLFICVAIGQIPYAVINEQTAKALLADYPDMNVSTSISFSQFQPWIVAKNNKALCDSLDSWLTQAKSMTDYQTIVAKYLK